MLPALYLIVQPMQHLHSGLQPKLDLIILSESLYCGENVHLRSGQLEAVLDAEVAGVHLQEPPELQGGDKLLGRSAGDKKHIILQKGSREHQESGDDAHCKFYY